MYVRDSLKEVNELILKQLQLLGMLNIKLSLYVCH